MTTEPLLWQGNRFKIQNPRVAHKIFTTEGRVDTARRHRDLTSCLPKKETMQGRLTVSVGGQCRRAVSTRPTRPVRPSVSSALQKYLMRLLCKAE